MDGALVGRSIGGNPHSLVSPTLKGNWEVHTLPKSPFAEVIIGRCVPSLKRTYRERHNEHTESASALL